MDSIESSLQTLYEAKATYVDRENYDEAESLHKRINHFKETSMSLRHKSVDSSYKIQLQDLNDLFAKEIEQFNKNWDEREEAYNNQVTQEMEELDALHRNQVKNLTDYYDNQYPYKQSPEFLNMKKIQYELARQERYAEAKIIKKKAEAKFKKENEKGRIEWNSHGKNQIDKLLKKQLVERENTRSDRINQQNLWKMERVKENDNMMIRYSYRKKDLEIKHKEEAKRDQRTMRRIFRINSVTSKNSLNTSFVRSRSAKLVSNV